MNLHLYERGYLITNDIKNDLNDAIPSSFSKKVKVGDFNISVHKDTNLYVYQKSETSIFLIGYAYK